MHCPRCGLPSAPGAKFCSECGAALETAPATQVTGQASRKIATVLFADIKGSTKAISAIDAESAMLRIRPIINAMAAAVREQGGTVIEVRGDGILSGFGALDSLEDHALAACRAALAIRQAAKSGASPGLPVRVGIHTGEVIVTPGEAGNSLMGASVHLASRLETAAEPNTILISEEVYRAVATAAEVQPRGRFTFKGFDQPVETWELLDVEHRSRWSARALLGLTPYCGRAPERALLTSFIEQTKQGSGGVLCISGDPGTGKSRFIHDALTSGLVDDCTIWFAESELPARHSPYAIARSIARTWLGLTDHNTAQDVERRLSAILQQFADSISGQAPALKALLNVSVADTEWANFDQLDRKRRLASCFLEISRLQARHRPLLVIVDDAQWCDPETLQVLAEFAQHIPSMPAGLILLERAGSDPPLLEGFAGASAIRLRELSALETQDFLTVLLGSHPSLGPVKAKLTEMAGGLPFFLEEAVRYLTRNGILVGEAGNYAVVAAASSLNIPDTVEALVSSRISSLSPDLRSVLSAASIVGRTGPLALIARICDSPVADVQPKLENLARQHILAISELNSETIFEFRHEFFRQVAYTMTLSSDRRLLHAKTLRAAEVLFDNRISDWITFLAYHAALASLHADAARYCRIAAEHAVVASSYSAASEFCEQAVKHLDQLPQTVENIQASIDVRLLLRVAAGGTSDIQGWLRHLTKSIELAEQIGDTSRRLLALIHRSWALNFSSSAVDAVRAGEAAVGLAQALRIPSSEALARFTLGQAHYANGGYRAAIESLTPATHWLAQGREMEQLGTTGTTLVLCLMMQANSHAAMGHFQAAEGELARLQDLASQTGRSYDQVALSYCRGLVWGGQARLDPTINALEYAYELCRKHGLNLFLPLVSAGLSAVLVAARSVTRAGEVALAGLEVAERLGHNVARSAASAALAGVRVAEANHREAIRLASEARSAASAYGHRGVEVGATRVLAQAFMASNPTDLERPVYLLREAIELGESIEAIPAVASCGLLLVGALTRSGQHEEAARSAKHVLALTAGRDMPAQTARLRDLLAELGATEA
jgi:class 3 adenylate cyclase/tetratricopeptide (TPR) repeat protein